jgi:alpha-galactosidase
MKIISFIGAGSTVFTRRLVWEITSYPELAKSEIRLMDIDADRLDLIRRFIEQYIKYHKLPTRVVATTDLRTAIRKADFVLTCIHPGGDEAALCDLDIPEKYGITQPVGDTLGPGGIFRGLRTVPHLVHIAGTMEKFAPNALLIQLSNPMAINTWAVFETSHVLTVGLCHGGEWTRLILAGALGVGGKTWDEIPKEWGNIPRVTYRTAGINHMAWYLDIRLDGKDVRDKLFQKLDKDLDEHFQNEWFRVETWRRFGYFLTESPKHHSEYVPFYRKHHELVEQHCPEYKAAHARIPQAQSKEKKTGARHWESKTRREQMLEYAKTYKDEVERQIENIGKDPSPDGILPGKWTPEAGAKIIRAIVTNQPFRFHGNVRNEGHITNLPNGCCVEVPCFADGFGINSVHVGELPPQCAALCRTNINVQELVVKAALKGSKQLARQALLLDPLTSSILSPGQSWKMADEMFAAEKRWLPDMKEK